MLVQQVEQPGSELAQLALSLQLDLAHFGFDRQVSTEELIAERGRSTKDRLRLQDLRADLLALRRQVCEHSFVDPVARLELSCSQGDVSSQCTLRRRGL